MYLRRSKHSFSIDRLVAETDWILKHNNWRYRKEGWLQKMLRTLMTLWKGRDWRVSCQ